MCFVTTDHHSILDVVWHADCVMARGIEYFVWGSVPIKDGNMAYGTEIDEQEQVMRSNGVSGAYMQARIFGSGVGDVCCVTAALN